MNKQTKHLTYDQQIYAALKTRLRQRTAVELFLSVKGKKLTATHVARFLGISRMQLYRLIEAAEDGNTAS